MMALLLPLLTTQCAASRSSSAHIDGPGVRYLHVESSLSLRKILEDELILLGSIFCISTFDISECRRLLSSLNCYVESAHLFEIKSE